GGDPVRHRAGPRSGEDRPRAGRLQRHRRGVERAPWRGLRRHHRDQPQAWGGEGDAGGGWPAPFRGDVRAVDARGIAGRRAAAGRTLMEPATRPLARERIDAISTAFLPDRLLGNRWDYYYSRGKLGSDPLYPGVCDALRGTTAPLLDLGCGLGLLAHALRADVIDLPYRGVDNDA